jgi:hypothetical protein
MQGESGKEGFFWGVRKLLKNKGFILLLITYGLAVAVINSLSTLLNQLILAYFPVCVCVRTCMRAHACNYTFVLLMPELDYC